MLTMMLGCEKIAPELAFTHSGLFSDPQLAYRMSMEYMAEQEQKAAQQAAQNGGASGGAGSQSGTPPESDG